jgi:hypothetical protein
MKKKSKKEQVMEKIFHELQSRYHVTGRELASEAFIYGDANVIVEEVVSDFEMEYGVDLSNKCFGNWTEFAESIAQKVSRKRKRH